MRDISGNKYGMLTAIRQHSKNKEHRWLWLCKCDCGKTTLAATNALEYGHKKSCGNHPAKPNLSHGLRYHPIYQVWKGMISRCTNPKDKYWENYGGRGIDVYWFWLLSPINFLNSVGCPPKGKQIDRIDNDKGYYPGNVKWSTPKENGRNRSNTIYLTSNGISKSLPDWADDLRIKRNTLYMRWYRGWSDKECINGKI